MRMRRLLVPIVGGLLATVGVAGSASATNASGEENPKPRGEFTVEVREAHAEFVECLREQGVDVPEDEPMVFRFDHDDDEELRAALEACREELGEPGDRHFLPFPAERMEELRGEMEAFHDCLREQGVDVPEPAELPAPPELPWDGERHIERGHHDDVNVHPHPFHDLDDAELKELREAAEACGAELPEDALPFFHHAA